MTGDSAGPRRRSMRGYGNSFVEPDTGIDDDGVIGAIDDRAKVARNQVTGD